MDSAVLHVMEGRLRIKVPEVKGVPEEARAIERQLGGLDGVSDVAANPVTGSVLVFYDTELTGIDEITEALEGWGYLSQPVPTPQADGAFGLGRLVLRATTEAALHQLFVALI
jgi:copper chaperone CopZ